MKENYARAIAIELVYEGGYVDNPKDPGGATMKGVTQGTFNSWRARHGEAIEAVRNISDAELDAIYKTDYWDRVECDVLPAGVDLCMFDAAVNSGVGSASSWAQAVCGVTVDGDFGPKTKTAIQAMDPETFIRDFNSRRLGTLKRLPTWSTFKNGWSARISNGQKIELAWAQAGDGPDPIQAHTVGGNAKANPATIPVSKTSVIVTQAATVGGAVTAGAAQAGQSLTGLSDTFAWMKYVLGGLTIVGAAAGLIVYFSKAANDAASNSQAKATVDPNADAEIATTAIIKPPVVTAPVGVATGVANHG